MSATMHLAIYRFHAYSRKRPSGERLPAVLQPWPLSIRILIVFGSLLNRFMVVVVFNGFRILSECDFGEGTALTPFGQVTFHGSSWYVQFGCGFLCS